MCASMIQRQPLKILVLGDRRTGKRTYVQKLLAHQVSPEPRKNNLLQTNRIQIKLDEIDVLVDIVIIGSSLRDKTTLNDHYRTADGGIIIFDITQPESFDNVLRWKSDFSRCVNVDKRPIILLANKSDLRPHPAVAMSMERIHEFCQVIECLECFKISATDKKCDEIPFQTLVRQITQQPTPAVESVLLPSVPAGQEIMLKILIIGELTTGKSSILQRYVNETFSAFYVATLGIDMLMKKVKYNNAIIRLQFWEVAGHERFGSMTQIFYRDAVGCFIVFDVTRPSTLINGAARWKDDLDSKARLADDSKIPCVLLANKCDLMKEGVAASEAYIDNFCRQHEILRWFETSALANSNINDAMEYLVEEILKQRLHVRSENESGFRLTTLNHSLPQRTRACCA